jgi:hypothetical protein
MGRPTRLFCGAHERAGVYAIDRAWDWYRDTFGCAQAARRAGCAQRPLHLRAIAANMAAQ